MKRADLKQLSAMDDARRAAFARELAAALGGRFRPPPGPEAGPLPSLVDEGTGVEFVYVPGGEFRMGLSEEEEEAARRLCDPVPANLWEMRPAREVGVEPFLISRRPVPNELAGQFVELDPPGRRNPTHPAHVRRDEAELLAREFGCRLPAEAEWEYACRAGTRTLFVWGDTLPPDAELERWLSWETADERKMKANPFGLYAMFTGEWCAEEFRAGYGDDAPAERGSYAVRGGGAYFWPWQDEEWVWCMSAVRMPSAALADGRCALRLVHPL